MGELLYGRQGAAWSLDPIAYDDARPLAYVTADGDSLFVGDRIQFIGETGLEVATVQADGTVLRPDGTSLPSELARHGVTLVGTARR